ncbi:MAG TPA: hypothetical protein VFT39_25275 [Vicinamibacterales bacterium]|nr:hypothetical protein [Vicinamibacterales bacterium]
MAWETGIPQWLHETKMPAVSIAIVRGGRLAWRAAVGVNELTSTASPVSVLIAHQRLRFNRKLST